MSILFATPCYGGHVTAPYMRSCVDLKETLTRLGVAHDWLLMWNESLVQRARNNLVVEFMRSDYRKLMFIDADIEFTPEDVAALWNMDADVAVGIYAMKKPGRDEFAAWVDGFLVTDLDGLPNPCELDYAGTGFMLIDRGVFERMERGYPEREYEGAKGRTFAHFDPRVEGYHYWSEDYAFCRDWRAMGGKVMCDPTVRLIHHGSYPYGAA